jgi:hypothetical protein
MTQSIDDPALRQQQRDQWIARVEALVTQIAEWSVAEGWTVERGQKTLREKLLGSYEAPRLQIKLPGGELLLEPIALQAGGGDGRVDLEAFPTLSRVKLIGGPEWRIITDSNVPLRLPWNRETYAQLAHDLLS